jgi:hypothetical protein
LLGCLFSSGLLQLVDFAQRAQLVSFNDAGQVFEAHYYAMRKVNRITFEDLACIVEAHKLRTLSKVNELKQAGAEEAAEQ